MFDYIIAIIAVIWLIAASISDIKTKEVPDWLNFSLISIAFTIFIFKSIIQSSFNPILNSLIGFAIFFAIGNLMYYSRQWGGGDSKLLYGLGALFYQYPKGLTTIFNPNLNIPFLAILFLNLLIIGSIYGILISCSLMIKKRKKFAKQFKKLNNKTKKITRTLLVLAILLIISAMLLTQETQMRTILIIAAITPLVFFYLLISVKAIESICMYKKIKTTKLVEGDWIAEDIPGIYNTKKSIGVTKKQIELIRKHKKDVIIKEGIAFVPPFLIATIISLMFGNVLF